MNDLSKLILDTAKGAMEVSRAGYDSGYLQGRRDGYEAGWQAAANAASEIANRPTAKDIKP
jgi:hypothetical protein